MSTTQLEGMGDALLATWMQAYYDGDDDALQALMDHLTPGFERRCRRGLPDHVVGPSAVAQDLVQELWVEVAVTKGRPSTRYAASRGSVRAWLGGILDNEVRMYLRRAPVRRCRVQAQLSETQAEVFAHLCAPDRVEEQCLRRLSDAAVRQAVADLPPTERELLAKVYLEDWSQADLARQQGISRQTLHHRHQRALLRLRRGLQARAASAGN